MVSPVTAYVIIATIFTIINLAVMFYKNTIGIPGMISYLSSGCSSTCITALVLHALGSGQAAWIIICLLVCSNVSCISMSAIASTESELPIDAINNFMPAKVS
jgi:hypothetical protein